MHECSWEMTLLDDFHDPIHSKVVLKEDEYPLVSFFAGEADWTLYTTHRMVGEASGVRTEINRNEYGRTEFGNFKQDLDSPRVTEAIVRNQTEIHLFLYESGYASMAPIYYFRFWTIKWPIWKTTYQLENEGSSRIFVKSDEHVNT